MKTLFVRSAGLAFKIMFCLPRQANPKKSQFCQLNQKSEHVELVSKQENQVGKAKLTSINTARVAHATNIVQHLTLRVL